MEWAAQRGIALRHIQPAKLQAPGKLQHNAYLERYDQAIRHEWLDQHIIESIERRHKSSPRSGSGPTTRRPNMGIGRITPAQKLKITT